MRPEADAIINVFRERSLRSGDSLRFAELGDAVPWEEGFIRDEPVREGFVELVEGGYVLEASAGLVLTDLGETYLYDAAEKHGARVYAVGDRVLIKQTVLRETSREYVIDKHRERHAEKDDDSAIAQAIRDALQGLL